MMETLSLQPQTADDIDWDDLTRDVNKKRCILFLGPSLPIYDVGNDKLDFYSLAAIHLSELLIKSNFEFDHSQSQNLYYIAQRFIAFKKNYRPRLEDEIADLYNMELGKIKAQSNETIPGLYKTILRLPWDTIVNTQPDNFFENALKPNDVFSFYHYKNKEIDIEVDKDRFLVYNLFGAVVKKNADYNVDSLILTEEDQVEFVRNLVSGNPRVPECVISRLDNDKTYIFLDCNLENWYFRLLLEMLKIHKESHIFSPKYKWLTFPPSIVEFYKSRYGFVFINNNSEDFVNKLWDEYNKRYPPDVLPAAKKIFMAYHDSNAATARSLINQLQPWVEKKLLSIWTNEDMVAGDLVQTEQEQFNTADSIILLINAQFLNEPSYSQYVKPALDKVADKQNAKKVFAVIEGACTWEKTPINDLQQEYILPANRVPIKLQQQQDPDEILYQIANSIINVLWK